MPGHLHAINHTVLDLFRRAKHHQPVKRGDWRFSKR
jgi:hypothetical protein